MQDQKKVKDGSTVNTKSLPNKRQKMIIDPMGQWAHPGENTRIPGGDITMQGVPYPVYARANNGMEQLMQPGQEYSFPGADYVDEYPMMQTGGLLANFNGLNKNNTNMNRNQLIKFADGSIVDYLASRGQNYSKEARAKLAAQKGIKDYDYSAEKNIELLDILKREENKNATSSNQKRPVSKRPPEYPISKKPSTGKDPNPFAYFYDAADKIHSSFANPVNSKTPQPRNLQSGTIVDKATNTLYVVNNGKVEKSFPVLTGQTGRNKSTDPNSNPYDAQYLKNYPAGRSTPTGTYFMEPSSDIYAWPGFMLNPIEAFGRPAPVASNTAMHITYGANPAPGYTGKHARVDPVEFARRNAGYSMPGNQRYFSYGCTNMQGETIDCLTQQFPRGDSAIYIDSRNPNDKAFIKEFQSRKKYGGLMRAKNGITANIPTPSGNMPSPEDDIQKYREFLTGFSNSPMGRQMLSASVDADDPWGINSSYADKMRITRNNLVNKASLKSLNSEQLNQSYGMTGDAIKSNSLQGYAQVKPAYHSEKRSIAKNILKNPGSVFQMIDSSGNDLYAELGAKQIDRKGSDIYLRNDYSKDARLNRLYAAKTGVHELSHAADYGGFYIPKSDIEKMDRYAYGVGYSPEFGKNHPLRKNLNEYNRYVAEPTETRARLNSFRYLAKEQGLYDPFTQKASLQTLKNYQRPFEQGNDPIDQLRDVYTDEQIVDLLNSVSKANPATTRNNNMTVGKYGGKIPPKNGGSTYSAGVWYMDGGDIPNYMQDPNPMYNFGGYFPQAPRFGYGGQTMDNTMMGMINVFEEGGVVEGQVMDVTPDMLQKLKAGGYSFEIIND